MKVIKTLFSLAGIKSLMVGMIFLFGFINSEFVYDKEVIWDELIDVAVIETKKVIEAFQTIHTFFLKIMS